MRKIFATVVLLSALVMLQSCASTSVLRPTGSVAPPPTTPPSPPSPPPIGELQSWTPLGLGSSTLTCVDKDGDGYGTGPGCSGPDADDIDASVHSAADVISKWGTFAAFLTHRHYTPTRYWVISKAGNDTTCAVTTFASTPDPNTAQSCATFAHASALIAAGDVIIWRAGTYTEAISAVPGTASHPVTYLAYPGELVTMNCSTCFDIVNKAYINIDGLKLVSKGGNGVIAGGTCWWNGSDCYGDGSTHTDATISGHDVAIRNVEVSGGFWNITFQNAYNMTIEDSVLHDSADEHNIYIGANVSLSHDYTIQRNLVYNGATTGMQINGRVSNAVVQQNIFYSNYNSGISLEEGVNHSTVRNNLSFNNGQTGLIIFDYDGNCYTTDPAQGYPWGTANRHGGICPYDQNYNIIENNTFWVGNQKPQDGSTLGQYAFQVSNGSQNTSADLGHQIIRNNILVGTGGGGAPYFPAVQFDQLSNFTTSSFENNILWSSDGTVSNNQFGVGSNRYTCAQAATAGATITGSCLTQDPQFVAANVSWWNAPANFNFRVQGTSPAYHGGTAEASDDVLGLAHTTATSIGAYQYPSSGTSLPAGNWVMVQTHGAAVQAVGWEKLVYSPTIRASMYQGNWHGQGTEYNNAYLAYDFEANRWNVLDTLGFFHTEDHPESDHQEGSLTWSWGDNAYLTICCDSGTFSAENQRHFFYFDPLGDMGRDKFTSPRPTTTATALWGMVYSPGAQKAVLYAGPLNTSPTWEWDDVSQAWTSYSAGLSPDRMEPSMAYNPDDGKVYLFGGVAGYGCQGAGGTYYSDVYTYDFSSHIWSLVTPTTPAPAGRQKAGWAYDTVNHMFLMYGGANDAGCGTATGMNDTWAFDPVSRAWTQLNPVNVPPSGFGPFERMVYDSDHNAFVMVLEGAGGFADGTYELLPAQTWLFRIGGVGPNYGIANPTYAQTAGINRNNGWAKEPYLATSGTNLYAAWSETGPLMDATDGQFAHIFASQWTGSSWGALGSTYNSVNTEACTNCTPGYGEWSDPQIAVVGTNPWITYYGAPSANGVSGATAQGHSIIYAKQWNGSSWTGGPIGLVDNVANVYQGGRAQLVGVGSIPYIAFIESDKSSGIAAQQEYVYVKHYDGSTWVSDGGALNRTSNYTVAYYVSAATDGTKPCVAWTEYQTAVNGDKPTAPQVYVSCLQSGKWTALGGSLNVNPSDYAADAYITYHNGQFYVAWTERSASANAQVYVAVWNGSSWSAIGNALNRNGSNSWALRPQLVSDGGTNLYLGWVEQSASGQKAQAYVSKWNGSAWSNVGDSLNVDSTNGSAQRISLAVLNGEPVAAWGEVGYGSLRQVYVANWNGTAWTRF